MPNITTIHHAICNKKKHSCKSSQKIKRVKKKNGSAANGSQGNHFKCQEHFFPTGGACQQSLQCCEDDGVVLAHLVCRWHTPPTARIGG